MHCIHYFVIWRFPNSTKSVSEELPLCVLCSLMFPQESRIAVNKYYLNFEFECGG